MNLRLWPNKLLQFKWKELVISILIVVSATTMFYFLYGKHSKDFTVSEASDVWFSCDTNRVYENMTSRNSFGHSRSSVHPLVSLQQNPPTFVLKKLGIPSYKAAGVVSAITAALVFLSLYILLRLMGCLGLDALLLVLLGYFSASAFFWLSVPESYGLGAFSIIVGLCLATVANRNKVPDWVYVLVSAFTLSETVTNWMVGLLSTFTSRKWFRACLISLAALTLVSLLWVVEKRFYPLSRFFLGHTGDESGFIFTPTLERIVQVVSAFFFHTIITPAVTVIGDNKHGWTAISIQSSLPGSSGVLSIFGSAIWGCLLLIGVWSLFKIKNYLALRITLGLTIIGQLSLHILYGEETFLYTLHFLPLLLTLVALSTLTSLRRYTLILVALLIPIVAVNNWHQLKYATSIAVPPSQEFKKEMQSRPLDPWPRADGHIVLAIPGTTDERKAYLEPGGSFSPAVGSFGLSIWLENAEGKLQATSDSINLYEIKQALDWSRGKQTPDVQTETEYYKQVWMQNDQSTWQMHLDFTDHDLTPSLLIRSVGPSGGQIRSLTWDGKTLLLNKRWALTFDPLPKDVILGEENVSGWKEVSVQKSAVNSPLGWGFARVKLESEKKLMVHDQDLKPAKKVGMYSESTLADLKLDLPDPRFTQSLNAQVAHMMMGLAGEQTRPGDPASYPLAWQRDGAYELVALARAGKTETAKTLSKFFAENDFFGGFGPEADAPGLSIWALTDVAKQLHDKEFDQWLWPHINRKAEFIERMLDAKSKIEQPVSGNLLTESWNDPENKLVAEAAQNGLIVGRMDHHRPLLFVNAVSYQGLVDAAKMAERLGHMAEANRWNEKANKLKTAWNNAFSLPMTDNERTYISALWPSWIATDKVDSFKTNLNQRWLYFHDSNNQYKNMPMWTYFSLAEAHQWLFLDRPDLAWSTVEWFWNHQSSPGLYTWWEGSERESPPEKWINVRGWIRPPGVIASYQVPALTPHYWTAAEMSLIQLDMLAYLNKLQSEPTLVIGAGVPKEWLGHEMSVDGLRVDDMKVDWHWHNNKMNVIIHGAKNIKVKLGKNFPANTNIELSFQELSI